MPWVFVFAAVFVCAMAACLFHQLHFFQLNSYKPFVHLKRELSSQRVRIVCSAVALLAMAAYFVLPEKVAMPAACAVMLVAALLCLPKRAKKPLVFTKRVVRMVITLAVIVAAVTAVFICVAGVRVYMLCVMAVMPLFSPVILLFANKINSPIEKGINNGFIREAKDLIDGHSRMTVIGVTGSYGKTSLKYFLGKLLSQKYNTLITPESYNTTLGVVRTIRENMRPTHEYFVCEMGARNVGDIKEICDIVSPDFGVITSVGEQHLESFKTLENIVNTKFELADAVPANGKIFVNMDSAPARERAAKYENVVGYGCSEGCDYRALSVRVSENGSRFAITDPSGETTEFETKLLGEHNVLNITGAVAVAHSMGVSMQQLVVGVRKLESVQHRLQLIRSNRGIMIDDAYNSNPSGAAAALKVLRDFDAFRILVTPGMVELGEKQYECNFEFGCKAAEAADIVVLIGEKQTKPIFDGLLKAGYDKDRIIVSEELMKGITAAEKVDTRGKQRVFLLENDLPDNY